MAIFTYILHKMISDSYKICTPSTEFLVVLRACGTLGNKE